MRKGIAILPVLLILALAYWWARPGQVPTVSRDWVEVNGVTLRVSRFELSRDYPLLDFSPPPPAMLDFWYRMLALFRPRAQGGTKQAAPEGMIYLAVHVELSGDVPREFLESMEYRLDYGRYTMGSSHRGWEQGRRTSAGTIFLIAREPMPMALEIKVRGEWIRIPIQR